MVSRVLLVDDVDEQREVLGRALRLNGIAVVGEASGGADAIRLAEEQQPDVVVLDLSLPDLAGQAVVTGIRSVAASAKIVVYSGALTPDSLEVARSVEAFVPKSREVGYLVGLLADLGRSLQHSAELRLDSSLGEISAGRRFAGERCAEWGCAELVDDVRLVATELVTNAVVHARTGCTLRVGVSGSVFRVEVEDHAGGVPDLKAAGVSDERGRGLLLVSVLCSAWGAEATAEGGKRVWAELSTAPRGGEPRRAGARGAA